MEKSQEESGISPQQRYQRQLVRKSHEYDDLMDRFNKKCEEVESLKSKSAPTDPKEFLLSDSEFTQYRWLSSLPDDQGSLKLIDYALDKEKVTFDFLTDLATGHNPFYLPVVKSYVDGKLKLEYNEEHRKLISVRDELAKTQKKLQVTKMEFSSEMETMSVKLSAERLKLNSIEQKTKAIDTLTDWFRQFYGGRLEFRPTQKELVNSVFKVENELHVLGLYGICNKCRAMLEKQGKWVA